MSENAVGLDPYTAQQIHQSNLLNDKHSINILNKSENATLIFLLLFQKKKKKQKQKNTHTHTHTQKKKKKKKKKKHKLQVDFDSAKADRAVLHAP